MRRYILLINNLIILIVILFGLSHRSSAQLVTNLGYTLEYSDNINREADKESSFINRIYADLSSSYESSLLEAAINGSIGFEKYSNSDDGDQLVPSLQAMARFRLTPRISWIIEDSAAQVSQDSSVPNVPSNREIQNVFLTGPDLLLPISPVIYLGYGLRYGNYYFSQTSEDNNQRIVNALRLLYGISKKSTVSLNSKYQQAYFSEDSDNDFDRLDLFFGYARTDDITSFQFSVGKTYIDQENSEVPDELLFCASLKRRLTSDSYLGIQYNRSISDLDFVSGGDCDAPTLFSFDQFKSLVGPTLGTHSASNELFVEETLGVTYTKSFKYTTVDVSIFRRLSEDNPSGQDEQSDQNVIGLSISYPLADDKVIGLMGSYDRQTDFNEKSIGLTYTYHLSSKIGLVFGFSNTQTEFKGGEQDDTQENRAFLSLVYHR